MEYLTVLIKPSSNKCNLRCKYCFYDDVSSKRKQADYDYMSVDTAHQIIDNVFSTPDLKQVHFGFQGGEPTLIGIEFYIDFFSYVEQQQTGQNITYSLQTNGILITPEWAQLFNKYQVLIGLSIDGPAKIHDRNRVDFGNNNSHVKVLKAADIFKQHEVEFNVLTVVTAKNALNIEKIYNYFVGCGFRYLQFIPCLEPLDSNVRNLNQINQEYYQFLSKLFKLWLRDYQAGNYISIRFIDNLVNMLGGKEPEACDMRGVCSIQNIIEADGTTFTCDFYAIDKYVIGNATTDSFVDMQQSEVAISFLNESIKHPEECRSCQFYRLCRNGCRRMRIDDKYMYCAALKQFYRMHGEELQKVALMQSKR